MLKQNRPHLLCRLFRKKHLILLCSPALNPPKKIPISLRLLLSLKITFRKLRDCILYTPFCTGRNCRILLFFSYPQLFPLFFLHMCPRHTVCLICKTSSYGGQHIRNNFRIQRKNPNIPILYSYRNYCSFRSEERRVGKEC